MSCDLGQILESYINAARKSHTADPQQAPLSYSSDGKEVPLRSLPKTKIPRGFQEFKGSLKEAQTVLISTHLLPDGDGLGAASALYHYLKKSKKKCLICNPDPLPKRYR